MKIAVDVCVGNKGIAILRAAGHDVVVVADHAESDRSWFARALTAGADLIVARDYDLEILAYDHNVDFCRAGTNLTGVEVARDVIAYYEAQRRTR